MREFVNVEIDINRYTYAYHYQRSDGSLLFRYDNSAHFPNLPNFPHHKHSGSEAQVIAADATNLEAVLAEVENLLTTTT